MAAIPCRYIYENAHKYFNNELDKKTRKAWEKTLKAHNKAIKEADHGDYLFSIPIIAGIISGLL